MIKLGVGLCVLFVAEKNGGRRRNEGVREEGRLSGHKLNNTDGFKSIDNSVCKNDMSVGVSVNLNSLSEKFHQCFYLYLQILWL